MNEQEPAPKRGRRFKEQTPVQRALGLLVRREHSRKELNRKLLARGIEPDAAQAAVDRLTGEGWQDDARFAAAVVRNRAGSGYGPLHIRAELGTHGLDSEAISAAMATFQGDWTENARDLIHRRFDEQGPIDLPQRWQSRRLAGSAWFRRKQIRAATRFDLED
nr:RecX [Xanthomonas oryzae pv. oryzae]